MKKIEKKKKSKKKKKKKKLYIQVKELQNCIDNKCYFFINFNQFNCVLYYSVILFEKYALEDKLIWPPEASIDYIKTLSIQLQSAKIALIILFSLNIYLNKHFLSQVVLY